MTDKIITTLTLPEFTTSHMPLAAYLKINGATIKNVTKSGNKGMFTFANVPRSLIHDFNKSRGLVEPNTFADTMAQLTMTAKRVVEIGA
jgi:hypothetical protein